ncbi:MAG TPA: ATP synthase F0 subunit B [Acidimicrobiales bacterium]|nr:ATP synthase F0 subunit B [Acidimicrobiales bacterium]
MHLVTVTFSGSGRPQVAVLAQGEEPTTAEEELDEGPSPILPEGKELLWSAGAFVVLAILVRLFLFPRIKKGMDARHELIRGDLEAADATRASAEAEVADYQAELAQVRAEANSRIDAARQTLEAERQDRLAVVNAEIAEGRTAAAAEAEAAKAAARDDVVGSAAQLSALAAQRVLGRPVDASAARAAVEATLSAGVR